MNLRYSSVVIVNVEQLRIKQQRINNCASLTLQQNDLEIPRGGSPLILQVGRNVPS